ncbi:hypothetical protein JRI60_08695 [Archangium violaceum]|uniref:hypothetical protein n=1 Tax=Archangium violaceum TaxID=83451 RepID=UPI00194EBBD1|nr:hypothetical protein [Archangium violaceum]QRN99082.1 hypothetical protein JRI60_08695 [Archangium violaceum]
MSQDSKKTEQKEQQKGQRTPGRKLTREELAQAMGGSSKAAIPGCCTQGCCDNDPR